MCGFQFSQINTEINNFRNCAIGSSTEFLTRIHFKNLLDFDMPRTWEQKKKIFKKEISSGKHISD